MNIFERLYGLGYKLHSVDCELNGSWSMNLEKPFRPTIVVNTWETKIYMNLVALFMDQEVYQPQYYSPGLYEITIE